MRLWNGLSINDYVIYNKKVYRVSGLVEKGTHKLCNLTNDNEELRDISVFDCKKVKD